MHRVRVMHKGSTEQQTLSTIKLIPHHTYSISQATQCPSQPPTPVQWLYSNHSNKINAREESRIGEMMPLYYRVVPTDSQIMLNRLYIHNKVYGSFRTWKYYNLLSFCEFIYSRDTCDSCRFFASICAPLGW